MTIEMRTPAPGDLDAVLRELAGWQRDDAPIQLHPGDLGWAARLGPEAAASAVRLWSRSGLTVAIGFLDGPDVLRLTVAPEAWTDEELARRLVDDAADPARGVLPAGEASVECPDGTRIRDVLASDGWEEGESWAPLRRNLASDVEEPGLRVETVDRDSDPERIAAFTAVHRSAWESPRFTDALWDEMSTGPAFADARCLLALDEDGVAVAGITIWGAGPGRPGLIEPLGVHADHRGRGYGREICLAAAAELRRMGASSALVCTEGVRAAAIATYRSAGFELLPERRDRTRRG